MLDLRTCVDIDRRSAILELMKRPKGGNFQIVDFRAKQHHAKFYIVEYGCGYDWVSQHQPQRCPFPYCTR